MLIYLIFFAITIVSMMMVMKVTKKDNKIRPILLLACCLPLCWLACMRDDNVGTDVEVYIKPIFSAASKTNSLARLVDSHPDTEVGYLTLNWIVSRFSTDFQLYLFIFELITLSLFVIGVYRVSRGDACKTIICFAAILLLFYNRSYNAARQILSISIVFLGARDLIRGNLKKTLPYIIAASLFHKMAFLIIPILLIGRIKKTGVRVISYMVLCLVIISYKAVIIYCVGKHLLPPKFLLYTDDFVVGFNPNIGEQLLHILLAAINWRFLSIDKSGNSSMARTIIVSDLILLQLGCFVEYASRACWYLLALYPSIIINALPDKRNKKSSTAYLQITAILIIYWCWSIAYCNHGETIPYIMSKGF